MFFIAREKLQYERSFYIKKSFLRKRNFLCRRPLARAILPVGVKPRVGREVCAAATAVALLWQYLGDLKTGKRLAGCLHRLLNIRIGMCG